MRRRSLAALVFGLACLALLGISASRAAAQRSRGPYRIGVLNDARAANHPAVDGLKAGLRNHGLDDGRDVVYDVRLTGGDPQRMPAAAEDLVKADVDVIFTSGEAATLAASRATVTIPIVFTLVGDPVAAGLVKSLGHPAGNVTGISSLATELVAKRLEVLRALAPKVRRVWVISHASDPASGQAIAKALEAAPRFGVEIVPWSVRTEDDVDRMLVGLLATDALLVPDLAALDLAAVLLGTSLARRTPAVFSSEVWVNHGGLVSYGADYRAQGAQAARLVAKILRGASPRDVPVEGADRILLALNLKTAASFGLTPPRQLLFQADVIRR
jgi:putative ABC transport system substrate-binding protein